MDPTSTGMSSAVGSSPVVCFAAVYQNYSLDRFPQASAEIHMVS